AGRRARLKNGRRRGRVKAGRHHYSRLGGPHSGRMRESIRDGGVTAPPRYRPRSSREEQLRRARTCYDHLAGQLGVGLAEQLCTRGHVVLADEGGEVTRSGSAFLSELGVDLAEAKAGRRFFCRPCLDWTERRPHIGGAVGAALATRCFDLGWVARRRNSRGLDITPIGRKGLLEVFGLSF